LKTLLQKYRRFTAAVKYAREIERLEQERRRAREARIAIQEGCR